MSTRGVAALQRVQRLIGLLHLHRQGLPLEVAADELGVSVDQLRLEIFEFYALEVSAQDTRWGWNPDVVQFVSAAGGEADPGDASWVKLGEDAHLADLPDAAASQAELARLLASAVRLLEVEPDNVTLLVAVGRLKQLLNVELSGEVSPLVATLQQAIDERRRVHVTYSRAWNPGVGSRTVEPYQLVHTSRGWELDAGPLVDGRARTFLLQRIRSALLAADSEVFDRPDDVEGLLAAEREPEMVRLLLPQRSQWVVDRFAESSVVTDSDVNDFVVEGQFLPPVAARVGLAVAMAGEGADVLFPKQYEDAGKDVALQLLRHHDLTVEENPK